MIIGISGFAGSGKDSVADLLVKGGPFVKVAFADPLKRIARDVYDFSDPQLWGSSNFRNQPDRRYPRRADYWEYPVCPDGAVWVPLLNDRGYTLIDVDDFDCVTAYRWTLNKKEEGKNTSYARASISGKKVSLHNFLMAPSEDMVVDHVNGNGLDNRRQNMRVCTEKENRQNSGKRKDGESVFKGVGRASGRDGWRAYINADGNMQTIGYYASEEEAAVAYDQVAYEKFGSFARLNSEMFLTPRFALQLLGSEWGRHCYPNTWVDYAIRVANTLLNDTHLMYTPQEGVVGRVETTGQGEFVRDDAPKGPIKHVVISDVRFKNEISGLRDAGGKLVRVIRTGFEKPQWAHQSEREQATIPDDAFDYILRNDEGLDELALRVDRMLQEL